MSRRLSASHAVGEQHAGDAGRGQGRQDPGEEGGQGDLGDVSRAAGGDLRQDADLGAEGANISEALFAVDGQHQIHTRFPELPKGLQDLLLTQQAYVAMSFDRSPMRVKGSSLMRLLKATYSLVMILTPMSWATL